MYKIESPNTVYRVMGIFYRLGIWTCSDTTTFHEIGRKLFYIIYFVSFVLSVAFGALTTDDNDECVFLTVTSGILVVQAYRLRIILWGKNVFLLLIYQINTHSTNDRKEFIRMNKKLNVWMKFVRYYLLTMVKWPTPLEKPHRTMLRTSMLFSGGLLFRF